MYWGGADGTGIYRLWGRWVWTGKDEKQERYSSLGKAKWPTTNISEYLLCKKTAFISKLRSILFKEWR